MTWIYNKLHIFSLDGSGLIPKDYIKQQECVLKYITWVMVIIMVQKVRESKNQFHASCESWGFMLQQNHCLCRDAITQIRVITSVMLV